MIFVFWFLLLMHPSNQGCDVLLEAQYGNISLPSHEYGNQIIEYKSVCSKSTIQTICINKSFISNVLSCTESDVYDEVCSYATEPRSWEQKCNLAQFYEVLPYWLNKTWKTTYWYPAKRNTAYGPYEFAVWGSSFGKSVTNRVKISSENVENIFEKDCLVQNAITKVIVPEYCSAFHRHNCSFSRNDLTEFCSLNCAYCNHDFACVTNTTTTYCTHLHLKKDSLVSKKIFYDVKNDFCSACFKRFDNCPKTVHLVLSFDEIIKKVHLAVYSPTCLSGEGNPDYIYCFTDASDTLRKRVDVKIKFNSAKNNYNVYEVYLEEYVGNYWCEANGPTSGQNKYKSNKIIAYKNKKGNEFAVRLKVNDVCNYTDCTSVNEINFLINDIRKPIEKHSFSKVRVMKVFEFFNESYADILIHVTTLSERSNILGEYYKLLDIIKLLPSHISFTYCRSSDRCLKEIFKNLTWPFARQFQTVLPFELCTQFNGLMVTRFCEGDFLHGLKWGHVDGECSNSENYSEDTRLLHSFLDQNISEKVINNVSEIVFKGNLSVTDLYFVSQILEKLSDNSILLNRSLFDASLNVINGLLTVDLNLLSTAQETLNLTDSFLRATEIAAVNLTISDFLILQKNHIIVYIFSPILQNASGFALYKNQTIKNIPLLGNFSFIEEIHNIQLALYIPDKDIQDIIAQNVTDVSVVALIYLNDKLFPSNTNNSANLVVNLNILNYDTFLQSPIPILINSNLNPGSHFACAFWDYGKANQEKKGNWSDFGSSYEGKFNNYSYLQLCSYSHLTHLALLVTNNQSKVFLDTGNDQILTLITAVGSLLSCLGIFGIYLTGFMFPLWRNKTGTQILMHLATATLLEIIFMYLNGAKMFDCKTAGGILQYIIICKFAWMLVYAFCQYLRFVRVLGPFPTRLVLKSIIFGWGFGIIPVVLVVILDPWTYYQDQFCYPNGRTLYLGVYMPIAIVLSINIFIFYKIMREVTNTRFKKVHSGSLQKQQVKLAILLFSVLGLPWIIGLISSLIEVVWLKLIFQYIFTATSIVQGFLMFLFYVLYNKETRDLWMRTLFRERKAYEIFSSKKSQSVSSIS